MPTQPTIRLMISSRCNSPFPAENGVTTLSAIRKELKAEIEAECLLDDSQLFEVWINEDAPAGEGSTDVWERCLAEVRKADIVLALYKGDAGWATQQGAVGICHAELQAALSTQPAKVRIIALNPLEPPDSGESRSRNKRYRAYMDAQHRFTGEKASNAKQLKDLCKAAVREAVAEMVQLGVREARKGKYHTGEALAWSRLDFAQRKRAMEETLHDAIANRSGSSHDSGTLIAKIGGEQVLIHCHGIPAPLTVASAREMVGQPFLQDHTHAGVLIGRRIGPLHIIACNRGASEAQALKQLGFPDATLVSAPFGVYAADNVQKIQLVFIKDCRDDTSTRHGVQRFFDWLTESGEDLHLAQRAASRKRIVQTIAKEAAASTRREGVGPIIR